MKNSNFLILFTTLFSLLSYGQVGDSLNANPENLYLIEEYKIGKVPSDYKTTFETTEHKQDFKKLRFYWNEKNQLRKILFDIYNSNRYAEQRRRKYNVQIEELERKIKNLPDSVKIRDIFLFDIGYYSDEMLITPVIVNEEILPKLKKSVLDLEIVIQQNQQLRENIDVIDLDIISCENQIDEALTPTYQKQNFNGEVSKWFTWLIALLLLGFFTIIYFKSDNSIGKEFLGDNGLQFITLFVLIIAVILFGILGILQATELAAILSGISGYILGRGASQQSNTEKDTEIPV